MTPYYERAWYWSAWHARRHAEGLCIQCGKPWLGRFVRCNRCRVKQSRANCRRYAQTGGHRWTVEEARTAAYRSHLKHESRSPDGDGPDVAGSANRAAVNVAGSLPEDRCMTTEVAVSGQPNTDSHVSGCGHAQAGLEPADSHQLP